AVTIQKILQTTKMMIERNGYNDITTTRIANEANLSVGIIYRYFPDGKATIIKELFKEGITDLIDDSTFDKLDKENCIKFVRSIISGFVNQHRRNSSILSAMVTAMLTRKDVFDDFPLLNQTEFQQAEVLMQKLIKVGVFSEQCDSKKGIRLLKIIDSLVHHHIIFEKLFDTDEQLIDFLTELIVNSELFKSI
ncbi:MAG: TetR/AcrR family transcriptional regulator, partial [Candidatus Hodarchaeales archaeon]